MGTVGTVNPPLKREMMQGRTNVRRRAKGVQSVDVMRGEMVEKELDAMIERRAWEGDVDPDEIEPGYVESVRRFNARREQEMRAAWCDHHQGQAARLTATLEALIARHEEQAAKLMEDQPKGAA
jgi:hypothetical protein